MLPTRIHELALRFCAEGAEGRAVTSCHVDSRLVTSRCRVERAKSAKEEINNLSRFIPCVIYDNLPALKERSRIARISSLADALAALNYYQVLTINANINKVESADRNTRKIDANLVSAILFIARRNMSVRGLTQRGKIPRVFLPELPRDRLQTPMLLHCCSNAA